MIYNLALFKLELLVFWISLLYILYYALGWFFWIIKRIKQIFWLKKQKWDKIPAVVDLEQEVNHHAETYTENKTQITDSDKIELSEIIKKVDINISKWEYDIAKNLIVEWLAIDKFNIELNNHLAWIYILEQDYLKSEYVYKDLLLVHEWNFDILKKLWYILSMQEKYDLAIEMYKKALDKNPEDCDTLNMLAHLCHYKNHHLESIDYLKTYLKHKPKDIENIILLAWCYKAVLNIDDAILTYTRALEIEPYNEEIKQEIEKLNTPEIIEENVEVIQEEENTQEVIAQTEEQNHFVTTENLVLSNDYDDIEIKVWEKLLSDSQKND